MKMEQTERSEASAYKIETPGNYPEESIQHSVKLVTQCAKYRHKIYKTWRLVSQFQKKKIL